MVDVTTRSETLEVEGIMSGTETLELFINGNSVFSGTVANGKEGNVKFMYNESLIFSGVQQ